MAFDRFASYGMESAPPTIPAATRALSKARGFARNIGKGTPQGAPVQQAGIGAGIVSLVGKGVSMITSNPAIAAGLGTAAIGLLTGGDGLSFDIGAPGPGIFDLGVPGPGVFSSGIPGLRQGEVPVKRWTNGTWVFYTLSTGRIATQKANGIWKIWRPQKHIVIPRNPRVGTLVRGHKRTSKLLKKLKKQALSKI